MNDSGYVCGHCLGFLDWEDYDYLYCKDCSHRVRMMLKENEEYATEVFEQRVKDGEMFPWEDVPPGVLHVTDGEPA